ncbi:filamentous hemagglutinin N-terminal domain-containing protein [Burkholderia pseudomallei]|uniref:two-partner secretion domain-containing protein n=1 Tax=Burkholderia pseudomallei TaxID=28450 RepID=UPI000A1A28C2|nr:filamentous hemagglutinin N-terminal domain-containing protein [Burkholderia pseudomallei]ARK45909.1 filamentous hemagglutinin [Burkholderia pseudomallei]RPE14613.1 filamentous hemagglutinin N-terminal domain-containing protein [Burkholderia pseudomallei]RPE17723.1 filamentous hemagglutinin N-terminal domain-containing protein [Burkholderia pseudomallei]RQS87540.1 filamentous hemagglutinin N-terminal domain-containing protein [Burkholderia pseudomallei]RQZ47240.1 filamentous hemagglutinin N
MGLRLIVSALATAWPVYVLAGGILPDGGTATTVSTAGNGRQAVNIAPAIGGVSNNTYSSFNVSKAGADLNNVGINARTIVNQVTSTNPSLIQGNVNVLGPRANVILANPNGLTVDGGSFTNTGHVVLSTGQVSFNDLTLAPGVIQRNVVLTTNRGGIAIGPGGLSGTLVNLDLIAKQLSINGPINNDFTSSTSGIRAIVGDSTATYDTSFSPSDNGHDWLIGMTSPATKSNAVAVDITAAGGLTAGRVQLIVTDQGAGVHSLGKIYANAGDVVITTSGDIAIADGTLKAERDIALTTLGTVSLQGAQVTAANNATIQAGNIALSDDTSGPSTLTAGNTVTLTSNGAIANTGGLIQAGTTASDGTTTGGDVILNAAGDITNRSSAANLGIMFAAKGQTKLTAGGNIINDNARILSNGAVSLTAAGDVQNTIDHTSGTNGGQPTAYSDRGGSFLFFTHTTSGFNVDYGTVANPNQLAYIAAVHGPVTISSGNFANSGGIVQSNDSDVNITAQNAFTNAAVFSGQASYSRGCWIFCHASASSDVTPYGGTIQAGGNVGIKAGTVARNVGGNVFANGDIKVDAPITYAQGVTGYSAINQHRGFKAFFGSTWAEIIAMDVGGGFAANGSVTLTGDGVIDGGSFSGGKGVTAAGGITTVRAPSRTPVTIDQHLGLTTWWWR